MADIVFPTDTSLVTPATGDLIPIADVSDSNNLKEATVSSIVSAGISGVTLDDVPQGTTTKKLTSTEYSNLVAGAASSTDNALVRFDSTTGKILQNGVVTENDTGDLASANSIGFAVTPTSPPTTTEGVIYWSSDEKSPVATTEVSTVNVHLGRELVVGARNVTGSAIAKGKVVYIDGSSGGRPTISLADASVAVKADGTIGVTAESISNNGNGYVTIVGYVSGIDTSSYVAGQRIYLSATPGEFTSTKPSSPNHLVKMGHVVTAQVSGKILVNVFTHFHADETNTTVTAFDKILSASDTDVQKALETIDETVTKGAVSSTDNAITRFDGTTGKIIQNSNASIDDSGNLTANNFSGTSSGTNTGDQTSVLLSGTGVYSLPSVTDNGDGTVTTGSGDYVFAQASDGTGPFLKYTISGGIKTLTDGVTNYLVADYNSGSPTVSVLTSTATINNTTVVPIYTIFRSGTHLDILGWDESAKSPTGKLQRRIVRTRRFEVEPGGMVLGESTGRKVTVTSGFVWNGLHQNSIAAFDSNNSGTDFLRLFSHVAGVWTKSTITEYNNTQYDDGTSLQTLTAGRYAVNWVFRNVNDNQKETMIVLGTGDYTITQAEASSLPSTLPAEISSMGILIGKIIVLKSASTATEINSAFENNFNLSPTNDHAVLSNLAWNNSGHTGTATNVAGFDGSGAASFYSVSGSGTQLALTNSPVFTTPVLGTPSSGTLTNCTFPTLNQDTTGKSAKTDALNSATTVVNVSSATAPSSGQVLTATSSTAATWQTPTGGTSLAENYVANRIFL